MLITLWEYKDVMWGLQQNWKQYYHIWSEPKKTGGRRWIHAPQGRLKELQQALLPVLTSYPLHPAARAYLPGAGSHIKVVQEHHDFGQGRAWWFEADIKDFFGHVTKKMLLQAGLPKSLVQVITVLHPRRGWVLPQGSPTSPAAANLVLRGFDQALQESLPPGSLYTRYADNLGISLLTPVPYRELRRLVQRLLARYGFQANQDKFRYVPPGQGQVYLGVRLDNPGGVSLPRRYAVNRLRSKLHHLRKGETNQASADGMVNYLKQINLEQYQQEKQRHGF